MNLGEIPGFYFDEEKQKYFGIEPNHLALPSSKYSQDNVKRLERKRQFQQIESSLAKGRGETSIKRPLILQCHRIPGFVLNAQQGSTSNLFSSSPLCKRPAAFVAGLKPFHFPTVHECSSRAIEWDPVTQSLINVSTDIGRDHLEVYCCIDFMDTKTRLKDPYRMAPHFEGADVSDIGWMAPHIMAVATIDSGIYVLGLTDPTEYRHESQEASGSSRPGSSNIHESHIHRFNLSQFSRPFTRRDGSFFACAANKFEVSATGSGLACLAVGGAHGVSLLQMGDGRMTADLCLVTRNAITACDWLAKFIVAAGQRDGCVRLWDVRAPTVPKGKGASSALRLRHDFNVDSMRCLKSGVELVAGGVTSPHALYDLRMIRAIDPQPWAPNPQLKYGMKVTQPLLRYPAYRKSAHKPGFDVHEELGILALTNDVTNGVDLFNLKDGSRLRHVKPQGYNDTSTFQTYRRNLKFVSIGDQQDDVLFETTARGPVVWRW